MAVTEKIPPDLTSGGRVVILIIERALRQAVSPVQEIRFSMRKPSPCPVAVFAFYSDRKNTSEKMKRQSNRHMPTPFAEVWLTACRCLQRPLLLRATPIAYHKLRQIARKHLCFFPGICKKREGKERGCFFFCTNTAKPLPERCSLRLNLRERA